MSYVCVIVVFTCHSLRLALKHPIIFSHYSLDDDDDDDDDDDEDNVSLSVH